MNAEQKFIKGFNAGYLIAKHNPELYQKLKNGIQETDSTLMEGFMLGSKEFQKEQYDKKIRDYYNAQNDKDKSNEYER